MLRKLAVIPHRNTQLLIIRALGKNPTLSRLSRQVRGRGVASGRDGIAGPMGEWCARNGHRRGHQPVEERPFRAA